MTPDRIRGFLRKPPLAAKSLQLCHETQLGNQPLSEWTRAELKDLEGTLGDDIADEITQGCQEVANTEQAPFSLFKLRWLGEKDRVLKSTGHRVQPNAPPAEDEPTTTLAPMVAAAGAVPVPTSSEAVWVPMLLKQLVEKDKQMNNAYRTALEGYQRTNEMLATHNEKLFASNRDYEAALERVTIAGEEKSEQTEEEREETIARTKAWEKVVEIFPDLAELGINAWLQKMEEDQARANGGSNGSAKKSEPKKKPEQASA